MHVMLRQLAGSTLTDEDILHLITKARMPHGGLGGAWPRARCALLAAASLPHAPLITAAAPPTFSALAPAAAPQGFEGAGAPGGLSYAAFKAAMAGRDLSSMEVGIPSDTA